MQGEHITRDQLAEMLEVLPDTLACPEDMIAIIYAVLCAYNCEDEAAAIFFDTIRMIEAVRKSSMN